MQHDVKTIAFIPDIDTSEKDIQDLLEMIILSCQLYDDGEEEKSLSTISYISLSVVNQIIMEYEGYCPGQELEGMRQYYEEQLAKKIEKIICTSCINHITGRDNHRAATAMAATIYYETQICEEINDLIEED